MIVANPAPLDTSYVPEKLFFRDDKIAAIRSAVLRCKLAVSNYIVNHCMYGI